MVPIAAKSVRRLAWLPLIACALNGAPSSSPALAQNVGVEQLRSQELKTIPLPPRRPPELGGANAPTPELRAPSAAPQAAPLNAPPDLQQDPSDLPTGLTQRPEPPYERRSMRVCGEEWQAMKRAGRTSGKVWRDFAADCLNRESLK